jgi:hypothetical protein
MTMNISKTLIAATLAVGVVGATTVTASASPFAPPQPTVYRTADMCDAYAKDYANQRDGNRIVRGVAAGAIGYLVGGFLFGTPVLGAAAGVATTAIIHGPQWQGEYSAAYQACISGAPLPVLY